jgi:hypothetical protein
MSADSRETLKTPVVDVFCSLIEEVEEDTKTNIKVFWIRSESPRTKITCEPSRKGERRQPDIRRRI